MSRARASAPSAVARQHSSASEDAGNSSFDDELLRQTTIIRIALHNANRSSDLWCRAVSTLISVFERSDGLLHITDPRIVACLRVAQAALEEVTTTAQKKLDNSDKGNGPGNPNPDNAKPIQLPAEIQALREFKCPEKDPLVLELCQEAEQAAAQLRSPSLSTQRQPHRCVRAFFAREIIHGGNNVALLPKVFNYRAHQ